MTLLSEFTTMAFVMTAFSVSRILIPALVNPIKDITDPKLRYFYWSK